MFPYIREENRRMPVPEWFLGLPQYFPFFFLIKHMHQFCSMCINFHI